MPWVAKRPDTSSDRVEPIPDCFQPVHGVAADTLSQQFQ